MSCFLMLCHKPNFLNICRFAVPDLSTIRQLYLWVAKEQKPFFKRNYKLLEAGVAPQVASHGLSIG